MSDKVDLLYERCAASPRWAADEIERLIIAMLKAGRETTDGKVAMILVEAIHKEDGANAKANGEGE